MDSITIPGISITDAIQLAAQVISHSQAYYNEVKHAKSDIERLQRKVEGLKSVLENAQRLLQSPDGARLRTSQELHAAVTKSSSELGRIAEALGKKLERRRNVITRRLNLMRWPLEKGQVDSVIAELGRNQQVLSFALSVDNTEQILAISSKLDFSKIPIAKGAAFDSQANEHEPTCLPDTRVEILAGINKWAKDPQGHCIYWLCGLAGTGKSTISRTVTHQFTECGVPTANFFFKKGEGDRGKASVLFTTVAAQLIHLLPEIAPHVRDVIERDPNIADKALGRQFDELILKPLEKHKNTTSSLIIVVFDALDECDNQDDVITVIRLLSKAKELTSVHLKFFVTSRPELPIRLGFGKIHGDYEDVALHEVPAQDIRHDILIYLNSQLALIRDDFNSDVLSSYRLPDDWPPSDIVGKLVDMSVPLFIFASTVCRFLGERALGDPKKQAMKFIQYKGSGKLNQLARTYLPILNQLLVERVGRVGVQFEDRPAKQRAEVIDNFREIVGTIVLLAEPLPMVALSELIGRDQEVINAHLSMLHSVLNIPKDASAPIKLFHLSFRDFLVDPDGMAENPFYINEQSTHEKMAANCLDLLSKDNNLKEDICGLKNPGMSRSDIQQDTINECIPPHVRYACLYWVFHLKQGEVRIHDDSSTHHFLRIHFLHWLEVFSLLGRVSESIGMIDTLLSLVDFTNSADLSEFLRDSRRTILGNRLPIDTVPLQLYSSVLLFLPQNSVIRQQFEEVIPRWIKVRPTVEMDWDPCFQTLEGHQNGIKLAIFSHDSSLIASTSVDNVFIWHTDTGTCIQKLQNLKWIAKALRFSYDSSKLAMVNAFGVVFVWDTSTWECIVKSKMELDPIKISKVMLLTDLQHVVLRHNEKVAKVRVATGKVIEEWYEGNENKNFSHDLRFVFTHDRHGANLWDTNSRHKLHSFPGNYVTGEAFPSDPKWVALIEQSTSIHIFSVDTGEKIRDFECVERPKVFEFSHDSTLIAVGYYSGTVRIWKIDTGVCLQVLEGHASVVTSVNFSHDSATVLSSSWDNTLRIWSCGGDGRFGQIPDDNESIDRIEISPDFKLILAKGSGISKIWRAEGGDLLKEFRDDYDYSVSHDSSVVAEHRENGTIQTWHFDGAALVQHAEVHVPQTWYLNDHRWCLSPDLKLVAYLETDDMLHVTNVDTGELVRKTRLIPNKFDRIIFSPDSSLIVVHRQRDPYMSLDAHLIWKLRLDSQEPAQEVKGISCGFDLAAISPSLRHIAYSDGEYMVYIQDIDNGNTLHKVEFGNVDSLVFSHDSSLVAMADTHGALVQIWSLEKGAWMYTINLNLGIEFDRIAMSFTSDDVSLNTKYGVIGLRKPGVFTTNMPPDQDGSPTYRIGLGTAAKQQWLTWNGKNLLWIPAKYRTNQGCTAGSTALFLNKGTKSAAILGFSPENLPEIFHSFPEGNMDELPEEIKRSRGLWT
ncbi:Vegetative incompatibility HET-E-1-like protein [Cladobotryum mycophilum]|uniref:Mitochondrial division protein 1 n=1 Tax=Cladobotryum mycophilum TaxID=491253 RepID=A0ABR0S9F1_9HYPO